MRREISSCTAKMSASGTDSWVIEGIPLAIGRNVITVTAQDATGNLSRVTTTAISQPFSSLVTVAGNGTRGFRGDNGLAPAAQLSRTIRVALDSAGNLYIADTGNHRIRRIRLVAELGTISNVSAASFIQAGDLASEAIPSASISPPAAAAARKNSPR